MSVPGGETAGTPDDSPGNPAQGKAQPASAGPSDPVDEETKALSQHEAAQHESAAEAQMTDAEESGGYGH